MDADGAGPGVAAATRFVYDGPDIVLAFTGTGSLANRYLQGPVIDQILADEQGQGGPVYWALADNLGTVRDLVNNSGVVQNHLKYDSFGKVTAETNAAIDHLFGYTGRERDEETGLMSYRARYYGPAIGKFLSEDPIGFAAGDPNLSRYVGNGPTNATDPLGLREGPALKRPRGASKAAWETMLSMRDGASAMKRGFEAHSSAEPVLTPVREFEPIWLGQFDEPTLKRGRIFFGNDYVARGTERPDGLIAIWYVNSGFWDDDDPVLVGYLNPANNKGYRNGYFVALADIEAEVNASWGDGDCTTSDWDAFFGSITESVGEKWQQKRPPPCRSLQPLQQRQLAEAHFQGKTWQDRTHLARLTYTVEFTSKSRLKNSHGQTARKSRENRGQTHFLVTKSTHRFC